MEWRAWYDHDGKEISVKFFGMNILAMLSYRHDTEQMEQFLAPEDIRQRQRFYDALNNFAGALKTALGTHIFYEETPEQTIQRYKKGGSSSNSGG